MRCPKCKTVNPDESVFCAKCGTQIRETDEKPLPTQTIEAPREELTTGSTFAGRYQIIEELGRGGMGRVYRALDKQLNEEVALKLIKPEIASDEKTVQRFSNELKVARKIAHKNIGKMFDLNEDEGTKYITMEYVSGQDLKGLIRQSKQLNVGTAISIAKQMADGLAEAHRLGIVHRDLKPSNIMIDKDGNARIMDFGIARSLASEGITDKGVMIGTPDYMSPEQVEGKDIDQRTDIYSLGVILYEMVTGKTPFEGDTAFSIAMKHKSEAPKDPKEYNAQIPDDLSKLILKCLEKDKERRHQSAGEVRTELENIEKGIPTTDRETPRRKPLTSKEITVTFGLRKLLVPALIFIGIVIVAIIIWQLLPEKKATLPVHGKPSIAVLPFIDLSLERDQEYFCDGMTDEIIAKLSKFNGWKVIPRTSVMRYKNTTKDLREIGQELDIASILEGSIKKEGNDLRVNAKLIRIEDSTSLWSDTYDAKLESVFAIQRDVAEKIANAMRVKLSPGEKNILHKRATENIKAYNLYLQGRFFWNKRTKEGLLMAIDYFQRALDIDPNYCSVYAGMADVYNMMASYGFLHPKDAYSKSKALALKALEIDEYLAEAYCSLAQAKLHLELDWESAESDFKKVIDINPNYATVHSWYSTLLMRMDRMTESFEELKKAAELDPISIPIKAAFGARFYFNREYDKAIHYCKQTIKLAPLFSWAYSVLGDVYIQLSLFDEAITEKKKAVSLSDSLIWLEELAYTYGFAGQKKEAKKILSELLNRMELEYYPLCRLALIYISLGQNDEALEYMEKAFMEKDSSWFLLNIKVDPKFDVLRDDPRFKTLLKKMNLE